MELYFYNTSQVLQEESTVIINVLCLKKANKTRAFNIDAFKKHAEVRRTSEHCPMDVKTEVQVEYNHNVERMVVKCQDL